MAELENGAGRAAKIARSGCLFGFILAAASHAMASQAIPTAVESPSQLTISYTGGQLTIDAHDANLAELLTKVSALTGVPIEAPPGASTEIISVVKLGPEPARQILASLLSDAHLDYIIQASDADPEKIQSVLILPRSKKGDTLQIDASARPSGSAYPRGRAPASEAEESTAADKPVSTQPEIAAAEASASVPQAQPDQPTGLTASQAEQSTPMKSAPLSPPETLTPQTINAQLQQMYQQRMQMVQQTNKAASPAAQP
jgi:hypothetical protein